MSIFKGAATAIITPFDENHKPDYSKYDKFLDFQLKNGISAIVVCGTTGETSVLNTNEHIATVEYVTKYVNGRVPVIAGIGSNNTSYAINLLKAIEPFGIDGALAVTPYYNKCTQNGLYEHYKAISDNSKTPIIMYNVPSRTGNNIKPETAAKIFKEVKNVVGIKEASGNLSQILKIMELTDGNIELYSGNDDQIVPILSVGGSGVISVLSNIAPLETNMICNNWFEGKTKEALDLQIKYNSLIDALFSEVNPIPVKRAVELLGYEVGDVALPLTHITKENEENLIIQMKKVGLL